MLNKVQLIGNLGADPELRSTASGQSVATLRVATTARWKDKDGAKQEATEWHRVVVWGRTAEVVGQYAAKGRQVYVEGRIQTRPWQDQKTGEKRYATEIIAHNVQLLGARVEGKPENIAPESTAGESELPADVAKVLAEF